MSGCAGAWKSGTVASRHHDNRHYHHHQLYSSTSTSRLVHCQHDDDCRQPNDALKGGETCHWLYEGCSVGICMCDPLRQKKHTDTGKCIPGEDVPYLNYNGVNLTSAGSQVVDLLLNSAKLHCEPKKHTKMFLTYNLQNLTDCDKISSILS